MNKKNTLKSSVALFTLATFMLPHSAAYALSLNVKLKPKLQETVIRSSSSSLRTRVRTVKIIKVAYHGKAKKSAKKSLISSLKSGLKKRKYSDIYFTKKAGMILEAEACRNDNRYFLQIGRDGEILQATQFDSCVSPKIKANSESQIDQEAATPITIVEGVTPKKRRKKLRIVTSQKMPRKISPRHQNAQGSMTRVQMLKKKGYIHIYAPKNRQLGVMACKNGVEYGFDVLNDDIRGWNYMKTQRTALGTCFGYGKQILSKKDLLTIMRRHGDTKIRVVRGKLPMFEAYSCLNGERRHIKINRWGNDNIRKVGKCS